MHYLEIENRIVYEDNHIIIVNKLPGELCQGDKTYDKTLVDKIKEYIKIKYEKPGNIFLGVLHRLDRVTSGLVIYCKTSKSLSKFNELFRQNKVKKSYICVVDNIEKNEDNLENYLVKNEKNNVSKAFDNPVKNSKKAILLYKKIQSVKKYNLLKIELLTGRHHQIRAQLYKINSHIRGDIKYGDKNILSNKGILLHAFSLNFIHPIKNTQIDVFQNPPNFDIWYNFNFKLLFFS